MIPTENRLKILTWHIHSSYLYYLTQVPCLFYLPFKDNLEVGYRGKNTSFPWGENVINVPAGQVRDLEFDCILFQSARNYTIDQFEILTEEQRRLPRIFLEHDPPPESPADNNHVLDNPDVQLVHVTHFNDLMWNSNRTPTMVIEHGVMVDHKVHYTGELDKGIVVVNGITTSSRPLGYDIFKHVREVLPLDLVGLGSEAAGGLGEIRNSEIHTLTSRYRFFFNPCRYTSLDLTVCEAMMTGLPVIGLATTEMSVTITNDHSGYIHTDINWLITKMKMLLSNRRKAFELSRGAKETALERFNIQRFVKDWEKIFQCVTANHRTAII